MVDYEKELQELEKYAKKENIPIMQKSGINYLVDFIKKNNIENILEIGTAIGYSAIKMALANEKVHVTTIERDNDRYLEAVKNINKFGLDKRIKLIYSDAFDVKLDDTYDLIFIDAAKAQNIKFFEKFEEYLNNGYIITDNLSFHGFVSKKPEEIESKNVRALVRKVKDYINFLENNTQYDTKFLKIGDGISISKKKDVE